MNLRDSVQTILNMARGGKGSGVPEATAPTPAASPGPPSQAVLAGPLKVREAEAPPRKPADPGLNVPPPDPQVFAAITRALSFVLTPEETVAYWTEQKLDAQLTRALDALSNDAARRDYRAQRAEMSERLKHGDLSVIALDSWTSQDNCEDYREKRLIVKEHRRDGRRRTWATLMAPIYLRWADATDLLAEPIESDAKRLAEKFALPAFTPFAALMIRKCAWIARRQAHDSLPSGSPAQMLAFVGITPGTPGE